MARIIAGEAGSLTLKVPQGATRPTSERVREAIFSALSHRIDFDGASVLDLYAGSGALGFEALSRGATSLIAVDQDRSAAAALKANQATIQSALTREVSISVRPQSVASFLSSAGRLETVDVVFIDPPYSVTNDEVENLLKTLDGLLGLDALIILERSAKDPAPSWPESWECVAEKTYGDTSVFTLEKSR